jgi:nucleotide-binding universal stress UspA family protein
MRILVGTDGSDDAVDAARQALAVLARPDVVTIVCVAETPPEASAGLESGFAGGVATPEEVDAAHSAAEAEAKAAIDATAAVVAEGIPVERQVANGDPGTTLVRLASELPADVVVVGSRGRGAIKRALLGSVSTHVANNATCPVVVVGANVD